MIMPLPYHITLVPVASDFETDPASWLIAQARQHQLRYLLAHADDGVIWGQVDDSGLRTSHGIAPASPPLRAITLQQARLFSGAGELFVWRSDQGWRARLVTDATGNSNNVIDEDQILWGDTIESTRDGFTLLREGSQGMRHAIPIMITAEQLKHYKARLRVRHYITENDDGEARITLSRLVEVLSAGM